MKNKNKIFLIILNIILLVSCTNGRNISKESKNIVKEAMGTKEMPLEINQTGLFDRMNGYYDYQKLEMTNIELIRGKDALQIIKSVDKNIKNPPEGKEYCLAKFVIKVLDNKDDGPVRINDSDFSIVERNVENLVNNAGQETKALGFSDIYVGGIEQGYQEFLIDKNSSDPIITYCYATDGNELWFNTNKSYELNPNVKKYKYIPQTLDIKEKISKELGGRGNPIKLGKTYKYDISEKNDSENTYNKEITINEVKRGNEVNDFIKKTIESSIDIDQGYELILIKVTIKMIHSKGNKEVKIEEDNFNLVTCNWFLSRNKIELSGINELDKLIPEESNTRYLLYKINKNDKDPKLVMNYLESDNVWFSLK